MNKSISGIIKTIIITLVLFFITCFIYTMMIKSKSGTQNYHIPSIIIGGIAFFILGFLASNHHQKRGILISSLYSLILISIIILCLVFTDNKIEGLLLLKYSIFVICAIIGGILGVNIKKFV